MRPLLAALRRTPEQAKPPFPFSGWAGSSGYGLLAGESPESQLRVLGANGTLFAIVDAYCTAMAGVTWHLCEPLPPGAPESSERTPVTSHAAVDLWDRPNAFYDRPLLVKTVTQHLELVGVGYLVVVKAGSLPVELWPVPPHRIEPVPDPQKFIANYIYTTPDGQRIPLGTDVVIRMVQNPCPWDPYRGMGAVQTVMTDLYGAKAAAEWHRNFFRNSARPDGVIEVPTSLADDEWDMFQKRWEETHRGVNNAHRVALLEHGATFKPISYSPHDMQFVQLRQADAEAIREAFRIPRTILGQGETLNRATAEAQIYQFAATHIVPRLEMWKTAVLNGRLLPMYGRTANGLEFTFVSPVPEDREATDRARQSKANAAALLVAAGYDPAQVLETVGLPPMSWRQPSPSPQTAHAQRDGGEPDSQMLLQARLRALYAREAPDLSYVLTDLNEALAQLDADYSSVVDAQIDDLARQVEDALTRSADNGLAELAGIAVPAALLGVAVIVGALARMRGQAASRAVGELTQQGQPAPPADDVEAALEQAAEEDDETGGAEAVAALAAAGLAAAAAAEALRLAGRYSPTVIAQKTAEKLRTLQGGGRRVQFGALLHQATNRARAAVFRLAVEAAEPLGLRARIVAHERNDANRCQPCAEFDGHVFESIAEARATYAGGYERCLGGIRCRGTFRVVWD